MALNCAIVLAPREAPNSSPAFSAAASEATCEGFLRVPSKDPLSPIAFWKSPRARGVAIWTLTEYEPADSPKIVTFEGSPPKAAMFRWTHRSAAVWSMIP